MTNATYAKVTAGLITAWFASAISASAFHVFQNGSARFGLPVALAALAPIVLFLLWFAASAGFRSFAHSLSPRVLTLVQTWRIGGLTFVVLSAFGILPGLFAHPAGWGDVLIGATAPLVAWRLAQPDHRSGFLMWQALGILDLVMAVALGTTTPLISPQSAAMSAMTVLPLSIVPTFLVPLLLTFHIICIVQARRWPERRHSGFAEQVRPSAA